MAKKKSVVITDGGNAEIASLDNIDSASAVVTSEETETATADDAAASIMESQPEVQPHVVEQHTRDKADAPRDDAGEGFDPSLHAVGSDGQGIKTAKGLWRRKRGAGKTNGQKSTVGKPSSQASIAGDEARRTQAIAVGRACAQLTFMTGRAVGGEEWNPIKAVNEKGDVVYDEESFMQEAYSNYAYATEMKDVPPGVILVVALTSYILPRFRMPETQKKAGKFKEWIAHKWVSWRMRRASKKAARRGADSQNTGG